MSGPLHGARASEAQEPVPLCRWITVCSCGRIFCARLCVAVWARSFGGVRVTAAMATGFLQTLLHFSWVNTWEWNCWAHGKVVPLLKRLSDCFPTWLYLSVLPPAACEGQYLVLPFFYSSYGDYELGPYYGFHLQLSNALALPGGSAVRNLPSRSEFSPWSGRSPEEGNGNPLQSSYLENPMDRGAWRATGHGSRRVGRD